MGKRKKEHANKYSRRFDFILNLKCLNVLTIVGTSNMDWLIYTICIVAVVIVTILSHVFRSYRKLQSSTVTQVNEAVVLEQETESPYSSVYDEIDEDMLTDDKIYFVPQENPSLKIQTRYDDTEYLDVCFVNEDEEQQKFDDKTSHSGSNSTLSSNSEVAAQNDSEYLNPYNSLLDNWKRDIDGYDVAVTAHSIKDASSRSDEESTYQKYSHVYQPLQTNPCMNMNDQAYAKPQTVNDTKIEQQASPSSHETNSLHVYMINNAESSKPIDCYEEMKAIFQNNRKPLHNTKSNTTDTDIVGVDADFTEHLVLDRLNKNLLSHENNKCNLNALDANSCN